MMFDESLLPFLSEKKHIVSLVGGGGKTTLMGAMASCCCRKGWKTLVGTTTHIMQPPGGEWAQTEIQRDLLWASGRYAVMGTTAPGGKLTAPPTEQLDGWIKQADAVFLEADGAKHLPCKAPAEHEPVLLPQSDIVLAVAGLSALGRPLETVGFRLERICAVLQEPPPTILTPSMLANLLASPYGGRKGIGSRGFYVILNQADTPERQLFGRQVLEILEQQYQVQGVLTSFGKKERA